MRKWRKQLMNSLQKTSFYMLKCTQILIFNCFPDLFFVTVHLKGNKKVWSNTCRRVKRCTSARHVGRSTGVVADPSLSIWDFRVPVFMLTHAHYIIDCFMAFQRGFSANRCAPQPREDILAMKNPTCDIRTYTGGLLTCHHKWVLLDDEQEYVARRTPCITRHTSYVTRYTMHNLFLETSCVICFLFFFPSGVRHWDSIVNTDCCSIYWHLHPLLMTSSHRITFHHTT